jgi:hypothetical protein
MQVACGKCSGLGSEWRLLQPFVDKLNGGVVLVLVSVDNFVLLLDGETKLAEGDDVESGILVASSVVDDGLEEAVRLGEKDFAAF